MARGKAGAPEGHEPEWDGITERRPEEERKMKELERRLEAVERHLTENTRLTEEVKRNTEEIVEFFQAGKGFFTVVRSVGVAAKWIATIGAGVGIAWAVVKFGVGQIMADMGLRK